MKVHVVLIRMFWSKLQREPLTQSVRRKMHWEDTGSLMAAAGGQGTQEGLEGGRGQLLLLQRTATAPPEDSHCSSRVPATGSSRASMREAQGVRGFSLPLLSVRKGASGDLCSTSHMERAGPSSQILIGPAVPKTRRN